MGDLPRSNRDRSAEDEVPAALSARTVSLAIWVEAVDLRGQVPYQLAFVFREGCCALISGRAKMRSWYELVWGVLPPSDF